MSLFTKTANDTFAPYDIAGAPRLVDNHDAQVWGTEVERVLLAFQAGGGIIFPNKATMDASLTYSANQMAWVMGDVVVANNGVYRKIGSQGTGSWQRLGDLPYSFIVAVDIGAGTPNAIQATTSVPVSGSALVWCNVFEANTASPVTISFNGGTPLTVKTNSGNNIAAGGLVAGMIMLGIISGSTFRLVSDQVSTSIVAAAEAVLAEFKTTYYGPLAADPTLNPEGAPVKPGDLYFNTTSQVMKYYSGSAWVSIQAPDPYASDPEAIAGTATNRNMNPARVRTQVFAIAGKYRFNVTNASYGAVGTNTGDQKASMQAAIDAAEAAAVTAGGADVIIPDGGRFRHTSGLRVKRGGVNVIFQGDGGLVPVGNFDTLRFESATAQTYLYRNHVENMLSFEAGKTGGLTLAAKYVADCEFDIHGLNGFSGFEVESFNTTKVKGKLDSYTGGGGAYYGRAIGGRSLGGGNYNARSDALMLDLIAGGTLSAGMLGIIIDGFVHTVTADRLYCVNIGSNGVITQNSYSATDNPTFLRFYDLQCDGCSGDSVRLNAGQDIVFSGGHMNRSRTGSNLYVSSGVKDVAADGTHFIGATKHGIEHYGKGLRLAAVLAKNNSNNEFGGATNTYHGLILGSTSRGADVAVSQFGDPDTPSFQAYGIAIDAAANNFGIGFNNVSQNQTGGIINNAGTGATKVVANNY